MISTILPRLYKRYLSLPVFGPIIDEFVTWSSRQGYTPTTVRDQLHVMRQLDSSFRQSGVRDLTDLTHVHFEAACHDCRQDRPGACSSIRHMARFLEETGRLAPRLPTAVTPTICETDRFAGYLRRVRGFEPGTIQAHIRYLKRFLHYLRYDLDANILARLTIKEIDDFLCVCAKTLNRYTLQHAVAFLRAFLRYQHERGVLLKPLHTMIDTPRVYRLEQIPRSLPWETVSALLRSIDRSSANGMRDYTMLYPIASYGLLTCEVSSLTLGILSLPQNKTRNRLTLPLTDAAAAVLIEYLERRPKLPYRELFLRIPAPYGPLKPTAVTEVFQCWARKEERFGHSLSRSALYPSFLRGAPAASRHLRKSHRGFAGASNCRKHLYLSPPCS